MRLLRIGAGGGERDKEKSASDAVLEKQRSKSLASYVDLEKKIKHEEEEKFKRVQRDREKMAEAEKKLKRAQERAAIELKRLQALGAGRGVSVPGVSSSEKGKGKDEVFKAGMILLENIGKLGLVNIMLGIFNIAAGISINGDIDTFTRVTLKIRQGLSYEDARAYTDSARSACTGLTAAAFFQLFFGVALVYFSFERKTLESIQDRVLVSQILYALIVVFTVVPFAFFLFIVVFSTWYSQLDNNFSTAYVVTNGMMSLLTISWGVYHASLWSAKMSTQTGVKAAAIQDAAAKAKAGLYRK
jgi:hypothetical protein